MLHAYAAYLQREHLMSLVEALHPPTPEACSAAQAWLCELLDELAAGRPLPLPPPSLVSGEALPREAFMRFLPAFTQDAQTAVVIAVALEQRWQRLEATMHQRPGRTPDPPPEGVQQAEALKDEFLAIVSHELRTPLNAVLGFGSILADELAGPLNPQQHRYLEKIFEGTEVLLALIDDLLDMSHIRAGHLMLCVAPLPLAGVVERVLAGFAAQAAEHRHHLITELPADLPLVRADDARLQQLLLHLVSNAIKFTPPGGQIIVRARPEGECVRCEVADNGPGIARENAAKLFQRFWQADMGPTRRVGGIGLGLALSEAIVLAHGGHIGVESEPGRGTTFWFTLPQSAACVGAA